MATFDGNGLVIDRLVDVKTDMQNELKSSFGDGINLADTSPMGILVGIMSERYYLLWEKLEAVYIASFPETSYGVYLDELCAFNGVIREPASFSSVTLEFTRSNSVGDGDVPIPAGTQANAVGSSVIWSTDTDTFIPNAATTVTVGATPADTGPIGAVNDSITVLVSAPANIGSVNNPASAEQGTDEETDAALKARRLTELGQVGTATEAGIRSALQALDVVSKATVVVNDTDFVDVDGRPAHSVSCYADVVNGTVATHANTIAQAIWDAKAAGIQTYGAVSGVAIDTNGDEQNVHFTDIETLEIFVEVTLTTNSEYDSVSTEAAFKSALAEYSILELTAGIDVFNYKLEGVITKVGAVGIQYLSTKIKISGGSFAATNITVDAEQVANIDESNVTFV